MRATARIDPGIQKLDLCALTRDINLKHVRATREIDKNCVNSWGLIKIYYKLEERCLTAMYLCALACVSLRWHTYILKQD